MLDELGPFLDEEKRRDLVNRLNHKDPEQSLGAEAELSLAWSLCEFDLEVEPIWWRPPKCPDAYVEGLIENIPLVIEVSAFSDTAISGEAVMDHCTQQLINVANQEKKGFGNFLYFHFHEKHNFQRGRRERGIAASKDYIPSENTRRQISDWINSRSYERCRLRIEEDKVAVDIEFRKWPQIRYHNFYAPRPPQTYSDTRNPLYRRLDDKSDQVRDAPPGVLRTIFLFEAGSRFLAELRNTHRAPEFERYSTAQQIIRKFLQDKSKSVDAVVVFIPTRHDFPRHKFNSEHVSSWEVRMFVNDSSIVNSLSAALELITSKLPRPKFDGYNARSLIRQKAMRFDSQGWYLSVRWNMENDKASYRMPARALQDFLARRISEEQFRRFVGDEEDGPSLGRFLKRGFTIQNVQFESGGTDEDDDYLVFELALDAAARPFQ